MDDRSYQLHSGRSRHQWKPKDARKSTTSIYWPARVKTQSWLSSQSVRSCKYDVSRVQSRGGCDRNYSFKLLVRKINENDIHQVEGSVEIWRFAVTNLHKYVDKRINDRFREKRTLETGILASLNVRFRENRSLGNQPDRPFCIQLPNAANTTFSGLR